MRVRVKLFATLRRFAPEGKPAVPFEVELPEGSTLGDLAAFLHIPAEQTRVAFINGIIHDMDRALEPGDEVGLFPPIGGG